MAFVKLEEYQAPFYKEKEPLEKQYKELISNPPEETKRFSAPTADTWSFGRILLVAFIGLIVNVVLVLIAAAVLDATVYEKLTEAERDSVTSKLLLSLLILPVLVIVISIIHNIMVVVADKKFDALKKTPEYAAVMAKKNEYDAKVANVKQKIEAVDKKITKYIDMGVIYIDGGKPSGTSYMGTLYVDGEENQEIISYSKLPCEFYVKNGTRELTIKAGDKVIWEGVFSFNENRVVTVDIAGANDSAQLSSDLDRYAAEGGGKVRYQVIEKSQYRRALRELSRKPASYIMQ